MMPSLIWGFNSKENMTGRQSPMIALRCLTMTIVLSEVILYDMFVLSHEQIFLYLRKEEQREAEVAILRPMSPANTTQTPTQEGALRATLQCN